MSFHLTAALLVWGLTLALTGDSLTSLIAGLLFCLHPMVNQNVTAAIFTNTAAYSTLLASFLLFVYSLRSKSGALLPGSLLLALVGLFLYESVIVVFGMMAGYLTLWWLQGRLIDKLWMRTWICGSAGVLLIFTVVRHFVVTLSNTRAPLSSMVHNLVVYIAALLSPVDPVLSHALFGASLPPNIQPSHMFLLDAGIATVAFLFAALALIRKPAGRAWVKRLDGGLILFLIASILMALGPVLVFSPHASETYLYLPVALYSIMLSMFLRTIRNRAVYASAMIVLLVSFFAGSWMRNQRVSDCGTVAQKIMAALPTADWVRGSWYILLANMPGEAPSHRYGVYGYEGLGTIDPSEPGNPSAEAAVQDATGNEQARVEVIPPSEMKSTCTVPKTCFFVSRDGSVHLLATTEPQEAAR